MKQEDINKLKELCESNGFYFDFDVISETAVVAKPKDIWEGVEFVEILVDWNGFAVGSIAKVIEERISGLMVFCPIGESISILKPNAIYDKKIDIIKPSTEEAYIEQLKKEAFKRFGDIKESENIIEPDGNISSLLLGKGKNPNIEWDYLKEKDILFYYSIVVYKQGKWAKKIEKAEVKPDGGDARVLIFGFDFNLKAREKYNEIGYWKVCEYLASQLQDYLNSK